MAQTAPRGADRPPASRGAGNDRGRRARAAIREAATALFAERGFAGTSVADVAEAAGVAKPSVLYHFSDKDTLWRECVNALWAEVDAFYQARWPVSRSPSRALLAEMLELFIEAALRWPAYIRIPFIEGASASWRSDWLVDNWFGQHVRTTDRILRACQARGLIPPGEPAHYQRMLTGGINVYLAQSAMWNRAFDIRVQDVTFLRDYAQLMLSLTFRSEAVDSAGTADLASRV